MADVLNVNSKDVIMFTNKLEKLSKSDFPIAVRQTLNDLAFDVKQNTLLRKADKTFIIRAPTFFKRFSAVEKAKGFDVNTMQSKAGIKPGSNIAAKNLTKQEKGGKIKKRSYIYMNQARVSRNKAKKVRKPYYLNSKNKVQGQPSVRRRSRKSNFVAAAIVGKKFNKFVLHDTSTGKTAYIIKSVKLTGRGRSRKANIKSIPIADFEQNRVISLGAKPFLKPAAIESLKKSEVLYIQNAKRRFEKALK